MRPPRLPRPVSASLTALGTAAYYATPDVIASRRARGWTKAALAGALVLVSSVEARTSPSPGADGDEPVDDEGVVAGSLTSRQTVALGAAAALAAALVASAAVAGERGIFRFGERRRAAGRRLPHTGPALVLALLAGVAAAVPSEAGRNRR